MNPEYLWLTGALQLLTFFVVGPLLAIAVGYAAWRKPQSFNREQFGMVCVAAGVAAVLMFVCARRINADVRETQYFFQLACVLLGGLLFGVFMGCGGVVLLRLWLWHKATRLTDDNQTEQ